MVVLISSYIRLCSVCVYNAPYKLVIWIKKKTIKFCVRLQKSFSENYSMAQRAYGDMELHLVLPRKHGSNDSKTVESH